MEELPEKLSVLDFYDITKTSEDDLDDIIANSIQEINDLYNKLKFVKGRLEMIGWVVDFIPLPLSDGGVYWSDYAGDYLQDKHGDDYWEKQSMYFTFYLSHDGKQLNPNREIIVNFSHMNREMKEKVLNIFYDELPDRFEWSGKNTKTMIIHFEKGEFAKLDFKKLKDNDEYPTLSLYIHNKCDDMDKIPKLKYYKKIEKLLEGMDYDMSYGLGSIELRVNGVEDKEVYKMYTKISKILNKYSSKDVPKKKRVTTFSADFWIDGNTGYVLAGKRWKIKGEKSLTLKDFTKKYKPKK